jgi:hypothetical protein
MWSNLKPRRIKKAKLAVRLGTKAKEGINQPSLMSEGQDDEIEIVDGPNDMCQGQDDECEIVDGSNDKACRKPRTTKRPKHEDDDVELIDGWTDEPKLLLDSISNDDVAVVAVRNATRLPHMRQHCIDYPFAENTTSFCRDCYCYVCDIPCSDCAEWDVHSTASNVGPEAMYWANRRQQYKTHGTLKCDFRDHVKMPCRIEGELFLAMDELYSIAKHTKRNDIATVGEYVFERRQVSHAFRVLAANPSLGKFHLRRYKKEASKRAGFKVLECAGYFVQHLQEVEVIDDDSL